MVEPFLHMSRKGDPFLQNGTWSHRRGQLNGPKPPMPKISRLKGLKNRVFVLTCMWACTDAIRVARERRLNVRGLTLCVLSWSSGWLATRLLANEPDRSEKRREDVSQMEIDLYYDSQTSVSRRRHRGNSNTWDSFTRDTEVGWQVRTLYS